MVNRTRAPWASLANTAGTWFGAILLVVGILGFIPGITQMPGGDHSYLLGHFAVDGTHNIVHLLTGLVGLAAGLSGRVDYARAYFLVYGIVYALVTIVGFIQGTTVLGIIPFNGWDSVLHVLITAVSCAIYFAPASSTADGFRSGEDTRLRA